CWRLDRIFPSIAAAIRPGDRWGRRDLFSRLPSSPSRRIHLYTVFGLTLKRRHSSRTFTPGCLPKATISFRNPTVWTTSFQANSMHLPASNYPNSGVTHVREHVLPMSEVHTNLGGRHDRVFCDQVLSLITWKPGIADPSQYLIGVH